MRQKITHEWLLEHGYVVNQDMEERWLNDPIISESWKEEKSWCKEPIHFYYNEDRRVNIQHRWTNRYGEAYMIHVDNQDYDSVGYLEVLYVDELEKFIEVSYDDDESCSN